MERNLITLLDDFRSGKLRARELKSLEVFI